MFRGKFECTIDDKGRVSVPVRFREFIQTTGDDRLVITNYLTRTVRCLDVYPYAAWAELQSEVDGKPQFDEIMEHFQNYYSTNAQDCALDKQGRILLPPSLREYAGLKRDIVLTSAGKKFRIWDREQWVKVFSQSEEILMQRPEVLKALGI